MAGFWPLYSNFVSTSQVTLALPGVPSEISKSVGGNSPALLLVPNVDFLIAFIKGNIGIADSMSRAALLKNINGPIAANNEMVTRHFSKINKLGLEEKLGSYKDAKGKIKIPKADINLSPENDSLGFKAMEKAILQSIFETQKPYMEIAKMVIDVMISVEDVIARIMPLISASPLTATSDKPIGNAGSGKRPKAIGYQGGKEIKDAIAALDKLTKIGGKTEVDKNGVPIRNPSETGASLEDTASDLSLLQNEKLKEMGKSYKIIDVVYSTGAYDPKTDYQYSYIDLPADDGLDGKEGDGGGEDGDNEDPYNKHKPKRIILGIFNSKGLPMNPNDVLYTINQNFDPNSPEEDRGKTITGFKKAEWITKSSKWVFPKSTSPDAVVWPTLGSPIYRYERGGDRTEATSAPGVGKDEKPWSLMTYKKGEKNLMNGFDAIPGDPVIVGFGSSDISAFTTYFAEYASTNMKMAKELNQAEKDEATKTIMQQINIRSHLENVNLYSQNKKSVYKGFSIPTEMKRSFKPMAITVEAAKSDPNLAGLNGQIWIDPESDYDMKIIQVKPTTKIEYSGKTGEPLLQVNIDSFIKNKTVINFSKGEKFNIDILKNKGLTQSFKGVDQYILENWNYSPTTRTISDNNEYQVRLWSDDPVGKLADLFSSSKVVKMGKKTDYTMHGNYEIIIEHVDGYYSYYEGDYPTTGTASDTTASTSTSTTSASTANANQLLSSSTSTTGTNEPTTTPRKFSDGIKMLGDGSLVMVEKKKITKWYLAYNKIFNKTNLPEFGKDFTITYDLGKQVEVKETIEYDTVSYYTPVPVVVKKDMKLWNIKVSNNDFPYGKVIDPSQILNEHLTRDELFSTGRYGNGTEELPQELGTVYRYAKTDLDTETYYIIEGIRPDENMQTGSNGSNSNGSSSGGNAAAGSGGGKYRLPHAIGAFVVFIKMLVRVFSKLIPSIMKLLKLFKNPMGFVTDIIMQKLGESFSVFSPEALKKFEAAKDLIKQKKRFMKPQPPDMPRMPAPVMPKMGDYVNLMKSHFANSKLKNHVAVDSLGNFKDAAGKVPKVPTKEAIGNFKFVYDGVGYIPFVIFGKDLSFGLELKMANVITKEWGNRMPMKLIFNKEKNSKDPNDLKVSGPSTDDGNNSNGKAAAKGQAETNSKANAGIDQGKGGSKDPNKRYVTISTWYSTGEFINGVDYKYIYIDQEDESLLAEVDRLSNSIDPSDLQNAKRKLEDAIAKDPEDEALKNKLGEIKKKIFDLNSNTQPLLKMILGIVTLPIKVIAGIIEWIMNFFKSLTNPMALPGKIIEFLSFKWIMDFFSAKGLMKMAGIEFDPSLIPGWLEKAKEVNAMKNMTPEQMMKMAEGKAKNAMGQATNLPGQATNLPGQAGQIAGQAGQIAGQAGQLQGQASQLQGQASQLQGQAGQIAGQATNLPGQAGQIAGQATNLPGQAGQITGQAGQLQGQAGQTATQAKDIASKAANISPADAKAAAAGKIPNLPKDVPLHKGSYALPDDYELADLSKFLNVSFLGQLPTYTVKDMRDQGKNIPKRLFQPIICFIEKLINGFIDFVWAILGIEAIIPPPHIKLCRDDDPESMDPTELGKLLNGETPGGTASTAVDFKADILATKPEYSEQSPPLEKYVYEVKLQSGETKRFLDRESLDDFMENNREIGFDFQF